MRNVALPLLMAPLPAVMFYLIALGRHGVGGILAALWASVIVFGAELLFVVPLMVVWKGARNPGHYASALWGAATGAAASYLVFQGPRGFLGNPTSLLFMALIGATCGLYYSYLVRRRLAGAARPRCRDRISDN